MENEKGVEREEINWFLRIITLGNRFSWRDFFDRTKKSFVEFLIIFFGVLVSFSVEQQGENAEQRERSIENLVDLKEELENMYTYTDEFIVEYETKIDIYLEIYSNWEFDNDSIFLSYYIEEGDEENARFVSPLGRYEFYDAFNPSRIVYDAIKLDGTFRFLDTRLGRKMNDLYDGLEFKNLVYNTFDIESQFVRDFNAHIGNEWTDDLDRVNLNDETLRFWIDNRKYIQDDKFLYYQLQRRLEHWNEIMYLLIDFKEEVEIDIEIIDKALEEENNKIEILYWWF